MVDRIKQRHAQRKGLGSIRVPKEYENMDRDLSPYSGRRRSVLDRHISIRKLLFYGLGAIVLAVLLVGVFFAGRMTVVPSEAAAVTANVAVDLPEEPPEPETVEVEEELAEEEPVEEPEEETPEEEDTEEESAEEEETEEEPEEEVFEEAEIGFDYSKITLSVEAVDHEMKGDNWGTANELTLKVINNENVIVRPYELKVKIYDSSDSEPSWWDEEVDVSADFRTVNPGTAESQDVDIRISFDKADSQKTVKVKLYDEFGDLMADKTRKMYFEE